MPGEIVVVGAGVVGSAIGWRLADTGQRVTLVDPTPGGLASPGSFAWLNASFADDAVYNRLRHDSLELWRRLKTADGSVPIEFAGAVLWEQEHFDLDEIARSQSVLGRPAELIDGATLAQRVPALRRMPDRALHLLGDGYGDPIEITSWFLDQAVAAGAEIAAERIEEILVDAGAVTGVRTAARAIPASHVVVAAGIDLPSVLAMLGLDVAMANEPGLLASTSPGSVIVDTMLATPDVHLWQRDDGGFLIGADFGGGSDFDEPQANANRVLDALQSLVEGTEECSVERVTVRERPIPADGRPAIGPLGPDGLYVVSTHSGMTLAPLIAECVTREIGGNGADPRLAPYRPGRAALRQASAG